MTETPKCESCGMPMKNIEEFGGGKIDNKYCVYCCDDQGNLKPYEDVLNGMTRFAKKMMNVSEDIARKAAEENMAKMPAWK